MHALILEEQSSKVSKLSQTIEEITHAEEPIEDAADERSVFLFLLAGPALTPIIARICRTMHSYIGLSTPSFCQVL